CFGAPFLPLHPGEYARLLGEKLEKYRVGCWLINTGWTGGPYGVGRRIDISHTRAMVDAVLNGELDDVSMRADPVFHFQVPQTCPGVPAEELDPAHNWPDPDAYVAKTHEVAEAFHNCFEQYEEMVPPEVAAAGPTVPD
ncbi:MAG: phosphoenolpyruvate carboxykinase (ATP), partial [Pseudomonadota bacterium]